MTSPTTPPPEAPQQVSDIDDQNPWPGLGAFDEPAERFFNGREKEAAELRRLVLSSTLTVVFGASGLGKTSLLRAGLFPLLRRDDLLPVYVRLDVQNRTAPLVDQLKDAMLAQFREQRVDAIGVAESDSLWELLHRETFQLWNRRNRLLTPLFVLDQFEEAFTLGADNVDAIARLRVDLADLVENRIPDGVNQRIRENDPSASNLALSTYRYKILISFREDFLPAVESWKSDVPSLMTNRLRLLPMSSQQAFQAVHQTAPHLADETIAREIVRFVGAAQDGGTASAPSDMENDANLWVEPALLSLVCRGLNDRRKAQGKPTFDLGLLRGTGQTIVSDYYQRSIADLSPNTRRFVEEALITERGYRKPCDVDDAHAVHGVADRELRMLVNRRLLRIEPYERTQRIELTHDLLTGVVREHRDRQRATAKTRKHWTRIAIASSCAVVLLAYALYTNKQIADANARARQTTEEAQAMLDGALALRAEAEAKGAALNTQLASLTEELKKLRGDATSTEATRDLYQTVDSLQKTLYAAPADNSPDAIRALARQLNDADEAVRKTAGARLASDYRANPTAVRYVLETLSATNLPSLSAAGRINALYFLSRSDSAAWTDDNRKLAREAIDRILTRAANGVAIGSQTNAELVRLRQKIEE